MESERSLSKLPAIPARGKVVVVKGLAGLGNRILAALGGILYGKLTGRSVVIDWRDPVYSSDGENVFDRLFRSSSCLPSHEIPVTESVLPPGWRGRLDDAARIVAKAKGYNPDTVRTTLSIDMGRSDYAEEVVVIVQYDAAMRAQRRLFKGQFQELAKMSDRAILARLLKDDLILRPEIRTRVDTFKQSHFCPPTVGVHIRFSDYRVRLLAIIKQLNALLKRQPDLQIFLATDNVEVRKMFERYYPRVITTAHWYGDPGQPIHTNPAISNRTEAAIDALVDLYLLAECDHLVYDGSSSFADLASLLSCTADSDKINVAFREIKGERQARNRMTRWLSRVRFSSWAFRLLPKLVPIRRL